jgi:hypothetical protein
MGEPLYVMKKKCICLTIDSKDCGMVKYQSS